MTINIDAIARYSDDALAAVINDPTEGRGPRNAAPHLLRLPTPELRFRAVGEAYTLMNLGVAGRYSEGVSLAVDAILRHLATGDAKFELYGERTAREYREAERARRDAQLEMIKAALAPIGWDPRP